MAIGESVNSQFNLNIKIDCSDVIKLEYEGIVNSLKQ